MEWQPDDLEASIAATYPIWTNSYLSSHPAEAAQPYIPNRWMDDKKWLQISNGYFVPPVTGLYMFSVFSRTGDKGDVYVVMSTGADGKGAYFTAFASHYHRQKLSRWLSLEQGRHYYLEFWQDYLAPDHWHGAGLSSFAVRLALTDASGSALHIPQAVSELGEAETGSPNCKDDESKDSFCFTGGSRRGAYDKSEQLELIQHSDWSRVWSRLDVEGEHSLRPDPECLSDTVAPSLQSRSCILRPRSAAALVGWTLRAA